MDERATMTVTWPDEVDAVFGGDLTAALAYVTPAGGTVLTPVAPIGLRDRAAGTVGFTTSLGFGRKLERIAANPLVALAYHCRDHGLSAQPGFALVQGRAEAQPTSEALIEELGKRSVAYLGTPRRGPFWDRWLSAYYVDRILVTVTVERILWWPSSDASGAPVVFGRPWPDAPASQAAPAKGTAARLDAAKLAKRLSAPHRLVGWTGADGCPVVVPVGAITAHPDRIDLATGGGLLPEGGRRAAVLAHDYRAHLVGLRERHSLGWMTADGHDGHATFHPHSSGGFVAPPNKTLLLLANGFLARRGLKRARAAQRKSGTTT